MAYNVATYHPTNITWLVSSYKLAVWQWYTYQYISWWPFHNRDCTNKTKFHKHVKNAEINCHIIYDLNQVKMLFSSNSINMWSILRYVAISFMILIKSRCYFSHVKGTEIYCHFISYFNQVKMLFCSNSIHHMLFGITLEGIMVVSFMQ